MWLKSGSKIPGILKLISQNTHNLLTLNTDAGTKIAAGLSLREIDLITWPDVYVPQQSPEAEPLEATLQIKLKKDKKDQVLKLVFGENNLEILNLNYS